MLNFIRSPNGLKWTQKTQKNKFSGLGLPGVEKLDGPSGILLHLSRASQLPYSEKSENCRRPIILNIFPIYSLLIPLRAAYGAQTPAAGRVKFSMGSHCADHFAPLPSQELVGLEVHLNLGNCRLCLRLDSCPGKILDHGSE